MIEPSKVDDYIPPKKKTKTNDNNGDNDSFRWNHTSYLITMKGYIDATEYREYRDWIV